MNLPSRTYDSSSPHPAFYDWTQSMAAAWDVWFATRAPEGHPARLANARLGALIAHARECAPFYRERYRDIPSGETDLRRLPVVTKADLMANFDTAVTDRAVTRAGVDRFLAAESLIGQPFLERYAVWTSSGTTGDPGVFLHDGRALATYDALLGLRARGFDLQTLLRLALLPWERYAFVGATGGHFAGYAFFQRLRRLNPWLREHTRLFSILDPVPDIVRALNAYRPTFLATYPSAADLLAQEQRAGRLAIEPRELWAGGETLSPAQRARIGAAFGCPIHNDYGASEAFAIAWECERGTLHLNADWVILEAVDANYQPVPAGTASSTALLTNLANRVQPLIRYDLGDSITMLETHCPCGCALPAMRVEGRCDDILALRAAAGGIVSLLPLALTTVLEEDAKTFHFQLVQTDASSLVLHLEDVTLATGAHEALCNYLRGQGLSNVTVHIDASPPRCHPISGKLQRIVAATGT